MVVLKECFPTQKEFIINYIEKKRQRIEILNRTNSLRSEIPSEKKVFLSDKINEHPLCIGNVFANHKKSQVFLSPNDEPVYVKTFNKFITETNSHLDQVLTNKSKIDYVHDIVIGMQEPFIADKIQLNNHNGEENEFQDNKLESNRISTDLDIVSKTPSDSLSLLSKESFPGGLEVSKKCTKKFEPRNRQRKCATAGGIKANLKKITAGFKDRTRIPLLSSQNTTKCAKNKCPETSLPNKSTSNIVISNEKFNCKIWNKGAAASLNKTYLKKNSKETSVIHPRRLQSSTPLSKFDFQKEANLTKSKLFKPFTTKGNKSPNPNLCQNPSKKMVQIPVSIINI